MSPIQQEKIQSPDVIETKKIVHRAESKISEQKVHYDSGYPLRSGRNPVCCRINRNYFPFYENDFY